MAPAVLPAHTAPPPTGSRGCWWVPTVGRHICQISTSNPVPTNGRHPPPSAAGSDSRGKLSKAGWVRLRGC